MSLTPDEQKKLFQFASQLEEALSRHLRREDCCTQCERILDLAGKFLTSIRSKVYNVSTR